MKKQSAYADSTAHTRCGTKVLSLLLCVVMTLGLLPAAAFAADGESAGTYAELKSAIENAKDGDTITLTADVDVEQTLVVKKELTLDLAEHKLYNTVDLWDTSKNNWSLISVRENGDLTITGNGTLKAKKDDCYAVDVQDETAKITIENGTFIGNISAVYVEPGELVIKGGEYSIQQLNSNNVQDEYGLTINCYDSDYKAGTAKVLITGGTFSHFNPIDNAAEGTGTNFSTSGYEAIANDDNYTVQVKSDNAAAIGDIQYATLADAVAAVHKQTGSERTQAIKLLKDSEGNGIAFGYNTLTSGKEGTATNGVNPVDITIDLNGYTYTVDGTTVGSPNTETSCFQILKGSKVTFENGSIEVSRWTKKAAYMFQNYGDLTLQDVDIDISKQPYCEALIHTMHGKVNITGKTNLANEGEYSWNYAYDDKKAIKVMDWNNENYSDGTQITIDTTGTISGIVRTSCYSNSNNKSSGKSTLTINNGRFSGAFSIDSDPNYVAPKIIVNGGMFDVALPPENEVKGTMTISGGYFTSDPSAYCVEGKTGVTNDGSNKAEYPWTVGVKGENPAPVASSSLPASVPEGASQELKDTAAAMSEGAKMQNSDAIEAAVKSAANQNDITPTTEHVAALNQLTSIKPDDGSQITADDVKIVYQTYVDMQLSDIKTTSIFDMNSLYELTVNLTPKYRVIATTNQAYEGWQNGEIELLVDSDEALKEDKSPNAILVQDPQTLNLQGEYEIVIPLPQSFPAEDGQKLSVKHQKLDGTVEYYTGTVTYDTYNKYLTFTTNGFSPFVISAAAAFIGDTAYPTLQEAVDNVKDNETITLAQDVAAATKVTVAKTVTFKVDTNSKAFDKDKNIVAGSNTTVQVTDDSSLYTYAFTYSRPSSSGSGTTRYSVTVDSTKNGSVSASTTRAAKGDTVTLTVKANSGYELETLTVLDKDGKEVKLTEKNGQYTFTMPAGAVTVKAAFAEDNSVLNFFYDVPNDAYYFEPVKWAVENGVTSGVGNSLFGSDNACTRAQIVTFLWKVAGSPVVNYAMSFSDVPETWYTEAVRWAVSEGITSGTTADAFSPDAPCTRAQAAVFLYRYAQTQGKGFTGAWMFQLPFTDVPDWAYESVAWCYMNGITAGVSADLFGSDNTCTRAQIVTFLYKLAK